MSKQIHMFEGMQETKAYYTSSKLSDTEFAASLSDTLGRSYSVAQVRQYRKVLGIPNNNPRPESELSRAKELVAKLVAGVTGVKEEAEEWLTKSK